MKLTLLGHSCFAVESGGYRVVLDPYYVESYPPLHTSANEVLCSHHHRDHDFVEAVELTPRVIVPMHYRHGSHGYDVIATVEDFLRLYPADEVHCLDGSSFELTPDAPRGVIVPKFMG